MKEMTVEIHDPVRADLSVARAARRSGDHTRSWDLFEQAHVLSQPWAVWHARVPGSILLTGAREGDAREVWGQLVRLVVAGPGSASGRYPVGITGRVSVSATQPMPISRRPGRAAAGGG